MQLGCCLALLIVPLLLLATPRHAMVHGSRHHAGAVFGRADTAPRGLTTSWTTPVGFADFVTATSRPSHAATEVAAPVTASAPRARAVNVSFRQVLPTTTTTTAPPLPVPSKPAPAKSVVVASTPKPPVPAPKPPPAPPAPSQPVAIGLASWYRASPGTCASPTLAFGTVVTVTSVRTGASVRCRVDDREAHNPGRVIDLAPATFSQLASLAVGVFEVRLSW